MHAAADAFSANGLATITSVTGATMGQRDGLSQGDLVTIAALYIGYLGAPRLTVRWEYCLGFNEAHWTAMSGATSYRLYSGATSNPNNAAQIYSGPYTDHWFQVNRNQNVWVKACNSSGCSSFSNMQLARYENVCY